MRASETRNSLNACWLSNASSGTYARIFSTQVGQAIPFGIVKSFISTACSSVYDTRVRLLLSDMHIPGLRCDQFHQSRPHLGFVGIYNDSHHWKTTSI